VRPTSAPSERDPQPPRASRDGSLPPPPTRTHAPSPPVPIKDPPQQRPTIPEQRDPVALPPRPPPLLRPSRPPLAAAIIPTPVSAAASSSSPALSRKAPSPLPLPGPAALVPLQSPITVSSPSQNPISRPAVPFIPAAQGSPISAAPPKPTPSGPPPSPDLLAAAVDSAPIPKELVGLVLIRELARGGQSVVWLGRSDARGPVAVKRPLPGLHPQWVTTMLKAAELQQQSTHPNILDVFHVGTRQEPFMVLEYAERGDASRYYATGLPPELQWQWARDIAGALQDLHSRDPPVAHRDVKGANAMITADWRAKLGDFDMALPVSRPLDGDFGTPGFTAPEVLDGQPYDQRVDIYSFGSLLFELTHMAPPFVDEVAAADRKDPAKWRKVVSELIVGGHRPTLKAAKSPAAMLKLISRCWAAKPDLRPSMADVVTRLEAMRSEFFPAPPAARQDCPQPSPRTATPTPS